MKISILVGHGKGTLGGYDPGACANGSQEFQIAKEIARYAEEHLRTMYDCSTELINYNADKSLNQRIALYKKKGSTDFLAEIHLNSYKNTTAKGTEVWYYKGDATGKSYAENIERKLVSALGTTSRGAKAATSQFGIIKKTAPTAVLIETCFISSPTDLNKVSTATGRKTAGIAIAEGIATAAGLSKKKVVLPDVLKVSGFKTIQEIETLAAKLKAEGYTCTR